VKGGTIATLSGVPRYNTLGLKDLVQGQRMTALVDGGATHNFIDASLVARRGLRTKEFKGFHLAVADGYTMTCLDMIPNLEVKLGNYTLTDTFYVVDLSDTDVVLGVQWLYSLGEIGFNYQTLTMSFRDASGSRVVLRGMSTGAPRGVSTKRLERIFRHGDVAYATECLITTRKDSEGREQYHPQIRELLGHYEPVFWPIPPGRPPDRGFEHMIELEAGATPVITAPYRHPKKFKDEIEKAIKELLAMGHIRPSMSPFASSVVLVLNKDGTLRMCIDYKALNKKMIKNCYTIPRIDELMDELHGAVFFTKIDLRSGYHQISIREQDIEKTAFRCHFGHFEFLVMLFGLTNAPATFQSCMNHIFRGQLRKYLLVFFDDILIYSKTWDEHLAHLGKILDIMQAQSLYAKESKCEFGMREPLYLGHIINGQGVHQWARSTGSPGKDQGHCGLANAQESHRAERILWVMQLLQVVRQRFFTIGSTTHRLDQEGCFSLDKGVTADIQQNEGGYEHMLCSSPSRLFAVVCLRVRRIRGGDWSSLDAGGPPHCV
jgi:hypothetical protein